MVKKCSLRILLCRSNMNLATYWYSFPPPPQIKVALFKKTLYSVTTPLEFFFPFLFFFHFFSFLFFFFKIESWNWKTKIKWFKNKIKIESFYKIWFVSSLAVKWLMLSTLLYLEWFPILWSLRFRKYFLPHQYLLNLLVIERYSLNSFHPEK